MPMLRLNLIALSIVICGCATPYVAEDSFGGFLYAGGYRERRLQDDVFTVTFQGNATTKTDEVSARVLERCAHLTIDNGFSFFAIEQNEIATEQIAIGTPGTVNIQTHAGSPTMLGTYANTTGTYTDPGVIPLNRNSQTVQIRMYRDRPELVKNLFSAEQVLSHVLK